MRKLSPIILFAMLLGLAFAALPIISDAEAQASGIQALTFPSTALTAPAPATAEDGTHLGGISGYRTIICAEAGQTISGGTLRFYLYDPVLQLWALNPGLDHTLTAASVRCQALEREVSMVSPGQRLYVQQSGVTVSAGTTVTVRAVKGVRP